MQQEDAGPRSGSEDSPAPDNAAKQAVSMLMSFGKCLGALLPVYLAGYFGFSLTLVLLGLAVYMGWQQHRDRKLHRLHSAMYLQENEQDFTTTRVYKSKRELPAWVNFPDVEKVEWLNKILKQAWPFVGQYLEKLLVETIAPSIRSSNAHLQTFSFTKVDLGDKPMKVVGVKAHTEHDKRQVLLDLYISYAGNVEINVEVKKYFCKAGVKGMQLHGKLRVILEPLIGDVPLVGAITMFFIRRPMLDINWTGLTNLLDIPGLNAMSDTMVMDAIASFLVLPNRLTVPLVADLHVAQLRSPLPRGIVRIHLLEAENLVAKDNYIKGVIAGKSDPYAVLRVGTQMFTSRHVDNNLNPQWREMYEVIVHEVPGQELEVEVFDKDPDQDDFLGRIKLDLGIVKKARVLDEWFVLKDAPTGKVHLRLEWLSLLPSAERLTEVLQKNQNITTFGKTADPPSSAILTVYLDRAQDLPMKKGSKNPSPLVQLSVQDTTKETRVKDDDRSLSLGNLSIPLSRLLTVADLNLDQWFQLENSGPASRIYLKVILRILWVNEEAIPTSPVSPLPSDPFFGGGEDGIITDVTSGGTNKLPTRPQHTSPDANFASEGVLRIHLKEAQALIAKDSFMGGMVKGKSDPYVKIRVGGSTFKTRVIKENLNPVWNELYEVILTALPGQEVQFDLYDKDVDQDDFLGRFKLSLSDLISSQFTDQQYGFMPRKSTTDAIFALRILMEKYRDGQRELHCVFVDLEKAYDRVPREELWYCMRKSGVGEKYVRVVQDMYERSRTVVRCAVGQTEEFKVEVGLHQGSALSPFLFAIVMDQLSEEVRQESPWTMMFADDIVICSESREQVEESLERWRFALERRGMKVSRSKTEYMCVNEREGSGTVRLQGEEVKKVQVFKYLGSTVQSNGECGKEWFNLNDVKSGRVHLMLEWVPRVSDPTRLEQILLYQSQLSYVNKAVPAAAILFTYIERAHGLPLKKNGHEPVVGAELILKNVSSKSKLAERSTSPRWDEAFSFLVHDPREEMLTIRLSHSWGQPLGAVVLPLRNMLKEPALVLDQWFPLDGALPESEILLRAELKLLHSKLVESGDATSGSEEVEHRIPSAETEVAANQELRHRTAPAHGGGDAGASGRGQVKLSIAYSTDEDRLAITVHGCRKLPPCSKDGSDPYVSFILHPDKNRSTKRKTSVKKRDLNPEFNERFDFIFSLEEAMRRRLDMSVKNSGSFMSREKETIGRLQLDLKQIDLRAGVTQWYDLTEETN
ncbi:hypothetical protein QTP70_016199 [Hemibagrus guttatus]|uniref:ribonuclease H n=1 Tax=Hemibagrus guttatus TaxID=175788 RepID=A0AAE0QF74_9TELE|nr:hypothetical protein QTP70_016199 [Hemibagrus guttatus]